MDERLDLDTLAAHAGTNTRVGDTISTIAPITASTTFTYDSVDQIHTALQPESAGFAYARNANPTVVSLEQSVAAIEGTDDAVAFGSGMAAISAALLGIGLSAGDSVVAASDLYGMTRSFLLALEDLGVSTRFVNILDAGAVERALQETRPRSLVFESISNPLLKVADVATITMLGHGVGATVILDNTFATPVLLRPASLGVDVVVHSATKYLAGHGDTVAGVVATDRERATRVRYQRTMSGGVLSPFEAWLTLRGIRTLPLRVARQAENALAVARWLREQPWVRSVYYPGLESHPQHAVAARQFNDIFGGMVAFELTASEAETLRFIDALQVISAGTSLGDVESLILYPPLASHRTLTREQQRELGIEEGLLRLSVGIESGRDLTGDLERAALAAGLRQPAGVSA